MVGEIVIDGNAVGFAAQLRAAAGIDKAAQRVGGIGRRDADVAGGGNRHQAVMHVVLAHQRPLNVPDLLAVEQYVPLGGVGGGFLRLPVALLAHQLLLAPAAHRRGVLKIDVAFRPDDTPLPRHDAHRVVELFLNGLQVVENVRVIELKIIEDQRARAVVNELGALVEEGAVVLVRFDNEERAVAQPRRYVEIPGTPPITKPGL